MLSSAIHLLIRFTSRHRFYFQDEVLPSKARPGQRAAGWAAQAELGGVSQGASGRELGGQPRNSSLDPGLVCGAPALRYLARAMRTDRMLVVTENMTVDGVIDATEGWFSPAGAEGDVDTSDLEATLREHMYAQDALLLGRLTFESFREYWPKQTDDKTGVTAHLNTVQKYVMSSTLEDPHLAKHRCPRR